MSIPRIRHLLAQPEVEQRLEGLALAEATGEGLEAVRPLLDDDAPYLFLHGRRPMVAEVRARALVTLEVLTRLAGRAPDFGPVKVRRAMPAPMAEERAAEAYRRLSPAEAASLRARVDRFLERWVRPRPEERPALHAYRSLQALALVRYREEVVDPRTYLTPLQQEIHASQVAPQRPRPHLEVRDPSGQPLGYVYRRPGEAQWSLDFAETPAAQDALRFTRMVFGVERGGIPRVCFAPDGSPLTAPDGSLVLDGTVPLGTDDQAALLHSLAAFVGRRYPTEVRP